MVPDAKIVSIHRIKKAGKVKCLSKVSNIQCKRGLTGCKQVTLVQNFHLLIDVWKRA